MMQRLMILLWLAAGVGCTPIPTYTGCLIHKLDWTFGPDSEQPYVDVCYAELPYQALDQFYYFVPIDGAHPSSGLALDANRDGISDNGRRMSNGNIRWGGNSCQQYAMRVAQKGCESLGDNKRSGGCDYIAIRLQAKPKHPGTTLDLTPVWHVRMPDGSERNITGKTLGTGYDECP